MSQPLGLPMSLANIRRGYEKNILLESALAATPLEQFNQWFEEALASQITDPSAMTVATAGKDGRPSARIVLLKAADERGFVFFTNYESRKACNIAENPYASLSFYWSALERQVHIEGPVEKTTDVESDLYHASRPLDSRIGAWASPQSRPIMRAELDTRMASLTESLGDQPPRPPFWGGYRVIPQRIEFWQGRTSRLHDRFVYSLDELQQWHWCRLAP